MSDYARFQRIDKRNIFDSPKHPKMKGDFEQHTVLAYKVMAKLTMALFSDLKKSIESNNLKSAFFITDILKDQMLDNLEENTVLRLSVINNGKKRGRKDLEKAFNAAKKQTN